MGVQTQINRILNEVDTQASLIAQIKTALEGKAGGGSSLETCTITVNTVNAGTSVRVYGCVGTIAPDGTMIPYAKTLSKVDNHGSFTILNVVVGSMFTIWSNAVMAEMSNGLSTIVHESSNFKVWSIYVTTPVGETGTITLSPASGGSMS